MEERFSAELRFILSKRVFDCAKELELEPQNTKVLVYSIMKYRTKILEEALIYLNVNIDDLIKEILILNSNEIVLEDPKIEKTKNNFYEVHNKNLLLNADSECKKIGHEEVGPEHVVLACLNYKGENSLLASVKSIMNKYGIRLKEYSESLIWLHSDENVKENAGGDEDEQGNEEKKRKRKPRKSRKSTAVGSFLEENSDIESKIKRIEQNLVDLGHIKNLNKDLEKESEVFIGREAEIERSIRILCRKNKRSLMVIGESGTGKTVLVRAIIDRISKKNVPEQIQGRQCYQIFIDNVVAGTKFRGEFEKRLKDIIDFISLRKKMDGKTPILFFDEIHTLIGAGAAEGSIDASGILKPKLSDGEIQCIGTTTIGEYRKYISLDSAFTRRFTNVNLEEPDEKETIRIIKGLRMGYQDYHKVVIPDLIIEKIVNMSSRYIRDRFFPDKAIDVLDEVCAKTVSSYSKKDREFKFDNYGNVVVPEDIIYEIMTDFTKIPLKIMLGDEKKKLSLLSEKIKEKVVGQDEVVEKVVQAIHSSRAGFTDPERPIAVFLFLGSTGVGKSYVSKILSEELFGSNKIVRLDMSEYMEKNSVTRIIGAMPGYVGYKEAGQLTESIRKKPYSVILLDEVEKAHPSVFNLFLQVFDEGRLTDSSGILVDFRNTIIIMTSNIGVSGMKNENKKIGFSVPKNISDKKEIEKYLNSKVKDFFTPEFLNRIDETVIFNNISKENSNIILNKEIDYTRDRLKEKGYNMALYPSAREFLLKEGFSIEYGARPIRRAIKKYIEQPLASLVVNGGLTEGSIAYISYQEGSSELSFKVKGSNKINEKEELVNV